MLRQCCAARWWRMLCRHCGLDERRCACCGVPFLSSRTRGPLPCADHWLCPDCAATIRPRKHPGCPLCGLPLPWLYAPQPFQGPCIACTASAPPWRSLACYGIYSRELKDLLLRFKFGEDFSLVPLLGHLLAHAASTLPPCHCLVPMPRHPARLRERGFNQVHELARVAAVALGLPLNAQILHRSRPTRPQARLSAAERRHNPKDSFAAAPVADQHVMLVDDILTTGATLHHATLALLQAGAASVHVAVVARALPHGG